MIEMSSTPKIVAVLVLGVLMVWFGSLAQRPLKGGPLRIVWLELAPTVASANAFLDAWRDFRFPSNDTFKGDWKTRLQTAQAWDTWLICFYAPLFALLCWLAAARFAPVIPMVAVVGRALAGAQLLAGALDFLENAAMNKMIEREMAQTPWPLISATASGIKWLLILAFLAYGAGAAIHWLVVPASRS